MADQPRMQLPEKQMKIKPPLSASTNKDLAALKAELEIELKNKKQCAYKPYECTQLTLDGFHYCLKHILQDKTAPYKQCSYIYASNGKRCQLAAPKIEKKDFGYCNEHAIRATLAKNRQNSRYPPPQTAEVLLFSLGHYLKKPRNRNISGSTDESDRVPVEEGVEQKTTKSLDPFRDIDANNLYNSSCNNILDFCSESDSDVEPSTFASVWHDAQNDSSDNESIDSDQEDVLKHANIYTAEEISSITRDKLIKLQSLYIEQYRHLQHVFKECNIYNQIRENPKEQRLYKKLKALNKYHKTHGVEAILNKRLHDSRAKITDGIFSKPPSYSKCLFTEGGVKCGERTLPLARHCRKHILEVRIFLCLHYDQNQVLFRPCGKKKADIECRTPVEAIFEDTCCNLHMDIPPIKSYAQLRKNSESDFDDSFESPENMLMESVSDSVKTEIIDYKPDPEEMKTLPSVLFEESSLEASSKNEDMDVDDKTGDEDVQIDVDDEPSPEGKLEIDLNDDDTNDNRNDGESSASKMDDDTVVLLQLAFRLQTQVKSIERNDAERSDAFLTIESALPSNEHKKLTKRSHSTLNSSSISRAHSTKLISCDPITLQTHADGSVHIIRTQNEKDCSPDRISLDRRGLTSFPIIDGEMKLRLLSLQHNLISNLEGLKTQHFPYLVFLDVYDNQLERMDCLNMLDNLRVLLVGKNRLRKIEGLNTLKKIEVLDLHGNQITHVNGLAAQTELKVLNLAGNQIRYIGIGDFQGLTSLQELNLRRNRLKKLLGFGETPNLSKLFISNNDLQRYTVRKAAMAWRRNKESTNSAFMDLTSDVCLNVRREEIISNARTNWELLRSQTKCLTAKSSSNLTKNPNNLSLDSDLILTSFGKTKTKTYASITTKVPLFTNKKLIRTSSQDTDNSQNTSSSNTSSNEFIRLPPILVPIIKKMEQRSEVGSKENSIKLSGSLSSIGPNIDSSSSLGSENESSSSSSSSESEAESENEEAEQKCKDEEETVPPVRKLFFITLSFLIRRTSPEAERNEEEAKNPCPETASDGFSNTNVTAPSTSSSDPSLRVEKNLRSVKSAVNNRAINPKWHSRASTAKTKKQGSPSVLSGGKDREQGGDYLIEICGRYLNVYGQCALRFIDRPWNSSKANDVNTVKFNYVNFNGITGILNKLKMRFPNVDNFVFKETNIHCLGQINALAEVQGLISLYIDSEGNPITQKRWRSYAIYRLSHWGLSVINDKEITEEEVKKANEEYQSLSDLVLWSLPDVLLQPLLVRLRLDVSYGISEQNAKKWLLSADPDLKGVVSKEALQWKKGCGEDVVVRQKAKQYISHLLEEMGNSVNKLRLLDKKWPTILHEFVRNALLDYSQLDMYMKQKILELK
ncbi:KAT8 regulatory NSL complex subunit 2 [Asbolus verrucosus]|uniref:KAT8 regulatory NSL complex subunit 2 n=1 Tax=Asbolus verrucosus TaxID=1661398 RepID=A0A482WCH8_ASBVE|nr:KAT8 regulatory NSL complex subunit 2 [Asbolus verrucosus]